jgi:formylglycine-generating enzyme required for sulfatase activity
VAVPAGEYVPFFVDSPGSADAGVVRPAPVAVAAFELDARPVTQEEFLAFVRANPSWRRSRIARLFADDGYLRGWAADLSVQPGAALAPVTEVSWFAAKAYCRWRSEELPTTAQWERAAEGSDAAEVLAWYGAPTPAVLPNAGSGAPNRFGVRDLHGLVWEWVLDFNATMATGEGRGDDAFFCGGSAAKAVNPSDYATFMRSAFRGSLQARFTVKNLGFRCARSP